MSRLAEIYKSEKTKGGGIFSTLGKRALEKIDPRQLFDQSGLLSAMAPKLFKQYSATGKTSDKTPLKPNLDSSPGDSKLDVIIGQNQEIVANSKIAAKNSLVLPIMMRDTNVMRQNIVKLVKLQGGTASTKADMFFKSSKEREAEYEVKYQKNKTTPTMAGKKPESKSGGSGMLSGLLGLGATIVSAITSSLSGLGGFILDGIKSVLSVDNIMKAFGIAADGLSAIFRMAALVAASPVFLGIAYATSVAALLAYLRSDYDKNKERYMELAVKKQKEGSLSENEQKELDKIETPNYREEAIKTLKYDPKTGKTVGAESTKEQRNNADTKLRMSVLDPGTAKLYLEQGEEFYKEKGYTKSQLELMAAGKKVDLSQPSGVTPVSPPATPAAATVPTPAPTAKESDAARLNVPVKNIGPSVSGKISPAAAPSTTPSQVPSKKPGVMKNTSGLDILNRAMDKEGITDEGTRERIIKVAINESSLDPNVKGPVIPSGIHKGDQAHGLLQVMPKTAEGMGFTREQIKNPETAALAGVKYFKINLQKFKGNLDAATVAHHAGPGGAEKWLSSGSAGTVDVATGLSTDNYLRKIAGTSSPTMTAETPKTPDTPVALAAVPTRPSSLISDSTVALAETRASIKTQPVIVNAPQTVNNVQQGGSSGSIQLASASVVDGEFMRLLVSRTI